MMPEMRSASKTSHTLIPRKSTAVISLTAGVNRLNTSPNCCDVVPRNESVKTTTNGMMNATH